MAPQCITEFKNPTVKRLSVLMVSMGCTAFLLYFFVGMAGYLLFSNCVCNNISVTFGENWFIAVGQFFVVLSVAFGTPTNVWPCRDALLEMIYPLTCGRHQVRMRA